MQILHQPWLPWSNSSGQDHFLEGRMPCFQAQAFAGRGNLSCQHIYGVVTRLVHLCMGFHASTVVAGVVCVRAQQNLGRSVSEHPWPASIREGQAPAWLDT